MAVARLYSRGKFTLLEGEPDRGKSLLICDLTARIVQGRGFPDLQEFFLPGRQLEDTTAGGGERRAPLRRALPTGRLHRD